MKTISFAIFNINDRALDNISDIDHKLKNLNKIEFNAFNAHKEDINLKLKELNIFIDNKSWPKQLKGEVGIWISTIMFLKKMVEEDIEECIILEDDTIISEDFYERVLDIKQDLPENYDFLTLVYPKSSLYLYNNKAEIASDKVAKAIYNHFNMQSVLWSKDGAKNFLELVEKTGITKQIDLYLFDFACDKYLSGYTIHPNYKQIVFHDNNRYKSTIDLTGSRGTLNV